ncbi:hypothetical protein CRG98_005314 [Punica granatum]|uniref:Uncharacterized protein n=1 Tax=Punica granatum TaxID=22663 RepID=A0A2I0L0R2_PUNGR|nr:hypothetical protein CRG98_005314 [Punica granatum]
MARMGFHESDLPSLGIRGKSRGSVRESGDSVERLEGCSGAKDARSGKDWRTGGRQARGQALGRATRRVGRRGCARGWTRGWTLGSVRLRVHCSTESTIFTRNEEINLK